MVERAMNKRDFWRSENKGRRISRIFWSLPSITDCRDILHEIMGLARRLTQ
jgi:hypothetical protein